MQNIFFSTLPIFLLTLLGSLIKRKWLISEEFWRSLEKLSYFLLFPAMLFKYISSADLSSSVLIKLVVALITSTTIVALILVIYRKQTGFNKIKFTSTFQGAVRYNSYIFFGLSDTLFGNEGLAIAAVISSYMIIYTNIISVAVFAHYTSTYNTQRKIDNFALLLKLMGSNPLIIASLLGFIFNYSGMELNLGIKKTISALSDSALAIGMLNVGAGLKFIICSKHFQQIIFTSFVKLLVLPLITVMVLSYMSINGMDRSIGVLYSCLPCASTAYVLSRQLGGDPESMAAIITFSTIFSVASLSILMYIFT